MKVLLLGPLAVSRDGRTSDVGGARLRTLLARLALDAGSSVSADALADAVWGDDLPTDQANALQSLISRLRRALPDKDALSSTAGGYRLDVAPQDVDLVQFERLARQGRDALEVGDAETASAVLTTALDLWRGPALSDAGDLPFAVATAGRLEELRLSALEDRFDAELALGRALAVVAEMEALAQQHPLRERLAAALIRTLYVAGRQSDAYAVYERTRLLLAEELGVDPGPQLQAAHLAILTGEADTPRRTNLRSQLTSFVGRDLEVDQISKRLEQSRLVTLVGPGGAGKTRLACEVGARLAPRLRHGVWLAELASVTDPDDLPSAVLGSLGLRETAMLDPRRGAAPRDALDRLLESLVDKETLVVLDNCEHLVEAAARLADQLLARCPDLRILATSREPLSILGEALYPVPPLGRPSGGSSPAEALQSAAVQLFVDRAVAARPGFVVDEGNVAAVTEICRRLDGLPLAIELAAARLRAMPVELVAARLDDRFRLLTGGSRTAMPRHRTLRAVVEWSWDLLDDDERRLAERIAVFPSGVTPASIEAVAADSVAAERVPDLLPALVDKSLVLLADGPRYRMLETIREYGIERLVERGEIAAVRAAHARYFLALAEEADPILRTVDQLQWIAELTAERDNLLAALRLAVDVADADTAVRLGAALGWFWTLRGLHAEADTWLGLVLTVPGEAPAEARAIASTIYGLSSLASGEHEAGLTVLRQLAQDLKENGFPGSHPMLGLAAAGVAMFDNDYEAAKGALDAAEQHIGGDPWSSSALRMMRAFIAENAGDAAAMRESLALAHEGFAELGERWGLGTTLSALGNVRLTDGDLEGALEAYEASSQMMQQLSSLDDAAQVVIRMAMVRARKGDVEVARKELRQVMLDQSDQGSVVWAAYAAAALADLERQEGDFEQARALLERAMADYELVGTAPPQVKAVALTTLGLIEIAEQDFERAAAALGRAYELAADTKDMPIVAIVAGGASALALAVGDPELSVRLLGAIAALRGSEEVGNPEIETLRTSLQEALGEKAYAAGYAEGRGLSTQPALDLLRSSVGTPAPPAGRRSRG